MLIPVHAGDPSRFTIFVAGHMGPWRIDQIAPIRGDSLDPAPRLSILPGPAIPAPDAVWSLLGVRSNLRYTTADEHAALQAKQADLGRAQATRAALIPIRKSPDWWALPQDERRRIFEESSRHTTIGLEYLPAIARRLYHSRDLGEPFDFLTWFEYAPAHEPAFNELLARLRASDEWHYVDREVDIRLIQD